MPKRKTVTLEETIQEEHLSEREIRRVIESNEHMRHAIAILIRGRVFATTRFPLYSGFLTKLRQAYDKEDPHDFLFYLRGYFEQARKYIPQVPVEEKTEQILKKVTTLVEAYGVRPVAACLLSHAIH